MIKNESIQIARQVMDLFYPLVELSIFDAKGNLQEIINTFSNLKEDQDSNKNFQNQGPFPERLANGKHVRCLIYSFGLGFIRMRYDLTHFKNLQDQLNALVQPIASISIEQTTDSWKNSIDLTIDAHLVESKISLQAASAKQKRDLITKLQKKGLLDFKESSAYVASKLQISRATVYNYLKTASELKKVHIHQVDAFTDKKFGGNPAGVVLDAEILDDTSMKKIARELNLSETAFVLPSLKGTFRLKYFTPTGHEIAFCGHSTVGALYMIAKEKRFGIEKSGNYTFNVETPCGILKMEITLNEKEEIRVAYSTPKIQLRQTKISHAEVAQAGGFQEQWLHHDFPVMYEETNKDLYVVVRSLKELKKVECNPKSLAQFSKQHDIVALCLFCPEAIQTDHQFHMRCFAPLVGIPEDPFTGSVLGGLTAYVDQLGLVQKKTRSFCVEQGHFIGRPGVVRVEYEKKGGKYYAKVFAQAVHCFSTDIHL